MLSQSVFYINDEPLKIKSDSQIEETDLIATLLQTLEFELNHNIEDSIAYSFNAQAIGEKLFIPSYFKDFLEVNIKMRNGYSNQFNPFSPSVFDIEIGDDYVIKKSEVVLDTSFIRTAFIVDFIGEEIKSSGIKNFLISFQNLLYSSGDKEWVFSHELLKGAYGISSEAILITEYIPDETKTSDIKPIRLIIKSSDLVTCRIEEIRFPEISTEKEFLQYAEENQLSFIVFDENWEAFTFP